MQFHDLGGFEIRGGHAREVVGEHGGDREVRRDEHALVRVAGFGERRRDLVELVFGPAGRADDDVDALLDEREHIAERDRRHGELDDDVGVLRADRRQVVAGVKRERELHVRGAFHRGHDVRSHAALGPYHRNSNHDACLSVVCVGASCSTSSVAVLRVKTHQPSKAKGIAAAV